MKKLPSWVWVVAAIIVLGTIVFLWLQKQSEVVTPPGSAFQPETISPSDEVDVLDQELSETDLSDLDKELNDIDASF
ncbi:MAG: hypothetical protein HYS57_01650 [Parcubacteria group bacterium]|nr:hypothetical protein [Parcubacteria group bacterium]